MRIVFRRIRCICVLLVSLAFCGCFSSSWINSKVQSSLSTFARFDQTTFYKGTSDPNSVALSGVCSGIESLKFLVAGADGGSADCVIPPGQTSGTWTKALDISSLPEGSITIKILDQLTNGEYATLTGQKDLTVSAPTFVGLISPSSSFTTSPTMTVRLTNLEVGSTIRFFSNYCITSWTTQVASATTEDFTITLPTHGTYGFNLNQTDRAGNTSSCGVFYEQYSFAKEFHVTSAATISNADAAADGICADINGQCSFRAALNEASADQFTPYIFNFDAGTYSYSACTNYATDNSAIKFVGAGPTLTIFDGNSTNPALCFGGFGLYRLHLKDLQFREFNGLTTDIFTNAGTINYEIENAEFRNNVSGTYGVLSHRALYKIKNSLFEGNSGSYVTYSWNANGSIDNSRYINNTTTYGHRIRGSAVTSISNSTFSGGLTAIYNDRGYVVNLNNITVSGNSNTGANLRSASNSVQVNIMNSTFFNNGTATNGNLYIEGGAGANLLTVNASNSIFAINNSKTNCTGFLFNYVLNFTNTLHDEASCGAGAGNLVGVDPLLGPLGNNGGSNETHLPTALSPVIDAGDNTVCTATDQRGLPRPVQKVAGSALCDLGAVEVQ